MIFLQLFIVFLQIGIFGFGGGYSMISLIQGQVVTQYHWMTMQEFTDVVAISQMTPGPIGINAATYCGYTAVHNAGMSGMMAVLGSAMATFALVLPSLVLMILISKMLYKYMNTSAVQSIFIGEILVGNLDDAFLANLLGWQVVADGNRSVHLLQLEEVYYLIGLFGWYMVDYGTVLDSRNH